LLGDFRDVGDYAATAGQAAHRRNGCNAAPAKESPAGVVRSEVSADNRGETMIALRILKGDATSPQARGNKIIAHVCNDLGKWGKGFVMALSARWEQPESAYRDWHRHRAENDFGLGAAQFVQVEPYIWVANMVAQHGVKGNGRTPPIRYEAVEQCLQQVAEKAREINASVHMPRIGCGLAGGKWDRIEPLIVKTLCEKDIEVTVYDL
jgi:O-acetyl-ADP-ribose deacetylase (regulator of RNase III)